MLCLVIFCGTASCGGVSVKDAAGDKHDASAVEEKRDAGATDSSLENVAPRLDAALDSAQNEDAVVDAAADGVSGARITVSGTIIDSYRQPMAGWRVLIGQTLTVTDANGKFTFPSVSTPYDVTFEVPGFPGTTALRGIWVYQGLTRPDPTMQADWTLGPHHRDLYMDAINVPTRMDADGGAIPISIGFSFGSPDTVMSFVNLAPLPNLGTDTHWFGGNSITGTMHTLAWLDSWKPGFHGLENQYLSYNEQPLTIVDPGGSLPESQGITLDFSSNTVSSAIFSASVQASWGAAQSVSRALSGSVVFDDNALISVLLVGDASKTSSVTAPMPVLPRSSIVFMAHQGDSFANFGFARREVVSPASAVVLDIPEPRTLISPPDGAQGIDTSTAFEWSSGPSVSVLSVECSTTDISFHTVSADNKRRVSTAPAIGAVLPKGAKCSWHVNVHGSYRTVDDATNPKGMIEPCLSYCSYGDPHGEGSGTVSEWRALTTAP